MVLARFLARSAPAFRSQMGQVRRQMSSKIEDVKIKDLPGYISQVARDPKTRTAFEAAVDQYHATYIKPGKADPIYHVIAIMMVCGYSVDYCFHLRHEANYKYH